MLCTVSPYFRQWSPPAFSATFPPMLHAICEDGSRGVVEPERERHVRKSRGCAPPGWTRATRLTVSTSRIRLSFARLSSTPSASGSAPPDRPVPAPRATTGTSRPAQVRITSCTCSTVSGSTATRGTCRVRGESVALVGLQIFLGMEHRGVGEEAAERFEQVALAGGAFRIVCLHVHRALPPCGRRAPGRRRNALRMPADAAT